MRDGMHRNSTVLRTTVLRSIVIPHLAQSRTRPHPLRGTAKTTAGAGAAAAAAAGFSSGTAQLKASTDWQDSASLSGTGAGPSVWPLWPRGRVSYEAPDSRRVSTQGYEHNPMARGHDPPTSSSSSRARTRAYLGLTKSSTTTTPTTLRTNTEAEPSQTDFTIMSNQAETSLMALQRILQAYERPFIPPKQPDSTAAVKDLPDSSAQALVSITKTQDVEPSQTTISIPSILSEQPTLPPIISRLLSSRLYRLAVFHTLSTPEYASDQALISKMVAELDKGGAGKLAKRLRRGWEVVQGQPLGQGDGAGRKDKGKMRLSSEPRSANTNADAGRLPPGHWTPIKVPPQLSSLSLNTLSRAERQSALTAHYNAHLLYLLTRPSIHSSSQYPITLLRSSSTPWPAPTPSLRQLRKLLDTITKLEKYRGFVPDRETAQIIIRCWLRSAIGTIPSDADGATRVFMDKEGRVRKTTKRDSESEFGYKEIRALFDVVSRAMLKARARVISTFNTQGDVAQREEEERFKANEWADSVRPFGKMVVRALREKHDDVGVKRVLEWLREQRAALLGHEGEPSDVDEIAALLKGSESGYGSRRSDRSSRK